LDSTGNEYYFAAAVAFAGFFAALAASAGAL
jgi:hypothetical protein